MPRTILSALTNSLEGDVTQIRALLQIDYTTTLRLYSGWPTNKTVDAQTWTACGFDVISYEEDINGGQNASVQIPHSETVLGAAGYEGVFLSEPPDNQVAKLWFYNESAGQTKLLLDGLLKTGDLDRAGLYFTLNLTGKINSTRRTPRSRWGAPAWNHVVAAGTIVNWKQQKYKIERG